MSHLPELPLKSNNVTTSRQIDGENKQEQELKPPPRIQVQKKVS